MKENTHYFGHDYNAQNDPKVEKMLCEKGNSAYGVFWRLIEKLAQEPLHKLKTEYKILAYHFHETFEFVRSVVEDFGLFVIAEGLFWSERLLKHFDKRQILSEKGRIGGLKRVANLKPPFKPPLADPSSILKETKGKEIKENEILEESMGAEAPISRIKTKKVFIKPTIEEIIGYIQEKGLKANGDRFFNYYESIDWFVGKKPMVDWKASLRNWRPDDNSQVMNGKHFPTKTDISNNALKEAVEQMTNIRDVVNILDEKKELPEPKLG